MKRQWVKFPWDLYCENKTYKLRDKPLEKLWGGGGRGGGRSTKKYSRKGKLNEKKIHAPQLILKNIHVMA